MSRKHRGRNRQIDRDEAPRGVDALPSRHEMIRALERVAAEWREKVRIFTQQTRVLQEVCGKRDWAPEFAIAYECQTERLRYAKSHLERLEIDLSELYSGATKGWPLRNEVFASER